MQTFIETLEEFYFYLQYEKNLDPKTVHLYKRVMKQFAKQYGTKKMEDIKDYHVTSFRIGFEKRGLKNSTIASYMDKIKVYAKRAYNSRLSFPKPIKSHVKRFKTTNPHPAEKDDLKKIIAFYDHKLSKSLRKVNIIRYSMYKAIILMLYTSGVRIAELCSMTFDNVNIERREGTIIGKGKRARFITFSEETRKVLVEYLNIRKSLLPGKESNFLFVQFDEFYNPHQMKPNLYGRLIRKHRQSAGVENHIHPHMLRHLCATEMLRQGKNPREIQEKMGRSSLDMLSTYTLIENQSLKEYANELML